jgi:hypothetical protein
VFSFVQRARVLGWHCLLRVCQDRLVDTQSAQGEHLLPRLRSLEPMANKQIVLRGREGLPQRTVTLQIAWLSGSFRSPGFRAASGRRG